MPVVDRRPFASTSLNARPIQRTRNGGAGYKAVGESRKSEARARGQKAQYEASKVKAIASIVSTVASAAGSVAKYAEAEQAKADNFDFKIKATEFGGNNDLQYNQSKTQLSGDGNEWRSKQLANFDQNSKKFLNSLPQSKQQEGQLFIARQRAALDNKSFRDMQVYRQKWAFDQTKKVLDSQILPNIGGDPDQNVEYLGKIDQLIDGSDVASQQVKDQLRAHAVKQVYDRWLKQAGPNASETAKEIINRYRYNPDGMEGQTTDAGKDPSPVTRQSPKLNIFKNASRVPSHRERAQIFRQGGVVVNLDTNSSKQGGQTSPMVVIPDQATAEQRAAAQNYAERIAQVYKDRFGQSLKPRVVTRSQNGRGRPFTIHTEPYSVKDTKAVKFFGSEEGQRLHAQILRETFGQLKGAQFSIPHNPAKGDHGAHGSGTNEVKIARSVLGWLHGGKSSLGGPKPDEKGPPQGNTVHEQFVRKLFAEEKKIEAYSEQMERRQEIETARVEREEEQATVRKGLELFHNGQLTKEWLEDNAGKLPNSMYDRFMTKLNPKVARVTDPETYTGLLERSDTSPEDVINEASEAYKNGQLSKSAFDKIYSKATRELNPKTSVPAWVKEQRSLLKSQLRPSSDATPEERQAYTNSLEQFDNYVEKNGKEFDRKELQTYTESLIKQRKTSQIQDARNGLAMPTHTSVGREAMTLEEVQATRTKLLGELKAGNITQEEAGKQWQLLKQWQKTLETAGEKVKPAIPSFTGGAQLAAGQSQVKGVSETVPSTVQHSPIPQTLDQGLANLPMDGAVEAVQNQVLGAAAGWIQNFVQQTGLPQQMVEQLVMQVVGATANQMSGQTPLVTGEPGRPFDGADAYQAAAQNIDALGAAGVAAAGAPARAVGLAARTQQGAFNPIGGRIIRPENVNAPPSADGVAQIHQNANPSQYVPNKMPEGADVSVPKAANDVVTVQVSKPEFAHVPATLSGVLKRVDNGSVTPTALYEEYASKMDDMMREPLSFEEFHKAMRDLGIQMAKIGGRQRYIGVKLNDGEGGGIVFTSTAPASVAGQSEGDE